MFRDRKRHPKPRIGITDEMTDLITDDSDLKSPNLFASVSVGNEKLNRIEAIYEFTKTIRMDKSLFNFISRSVPGSSISI
jgi:hypothetical protein